MQRTRWMSLLLVIVLLIPLFAQQAFLALSDSGRNENVALKETPSHAYSYLIDYVSHDPINIVSNADFAAQKAVEGWAGNGTIDDPYIIEGYNITYNGYDIRVSNVAAHFIIRNCYLTSNGTVKNDPYDDGVNFYNVTSGTVTNNIMVNNTDGAIYFGDSKGVIAENTIFGNRLGIVLANSSASVTTNDVTGSNDVSILILDSFDSDISDNYASTIYGDSILLYNATGCTVIHNRFENHSATFRSCRDCTISINSCREGSGILLDSSSEMTVSFNQIIYPIWTGIEVFRCNLTTVSYNGIWDVNGDGILVNQSDTCQVYGNEAWSCLNGIEIVDERNSTFTFNQIFNQQNYGIRITNGFENTLYGNLLTNDGYGRAADWGTDNQWDDGRLIGNFWEGIEEGSLEILGTANSLDRFARTINNTGFADLQIYHEPIVNIVDGTGAFLTWIVWCKQFRYEIYANDTPIDGGYCLDTGVVMIDISDLSNGFYSFVLRVYPLHIMLDPVGYIASTPFNSTIPDIWFLDSDSDGMPNIWEIENGLNPNVDDSGLDYDSDGLTNLQEYILGTNPTSSDSDFDTFPDAWEVRHGFNATDPTVSLMEYFVFYSPFIATISGVVIMVVGVLLFRYKQMGPQRKTLVPDAEEEKQEALDELLQ